LTTLLSDEAKAKERFFATFDIVKGMVGVVKDMPSAVIALWPELEERKLLQRAGQTGASLKDTSKILGRVDSAFKLYKGLELLYSDNADVKYEQQMNRPFRAELQQYSNIANIVLGAMSGVELAGAVLAAAGTTHVLGCATASIAVFTATGWGLIFSVGGAIIAAGATFALDLTQPWTEEYQKIETGWQKACQEEVRGTRFKVAERLEHLLETVNRSDLMKPAI
jgi:hypothetical protein